MSGIDIISDTTGQAIVESIKALGTKLSEGRVIYGVHINSADSNPKTRVRYLADAVGMAPAAMNFTSGTFDYGSWANAFLCQNHACSKRMDRLIIISTRMI